MRSFDHALRRFAAIGLGLGLSLTAGVAAAQGTPDQPSTDPVTPTEPATPIDPANPPPPVPPPVVTEPVIVTTPAPATTYTPVYTEPVIVAREEPFLERYGVAFVLGGGVEGFTDNSMRSSTKDGGNWDARAIFGTRDWVGFEAAYIGSAQSIDALGLNNNALLVGNGVQGNLRLNFTKDQLVQPFAYAGAAWRHYNLQNNGGVNTSDVRDKDDVLEIPVGVGLAYKYAGFMFDARGELRAARGEDLMPTLSGLDGSERAEMHRWGVNANIGYAF